MMKPLSATVGVRPATAATIREPTAPAPAMGRVQLCEGTNQDQVICARSCLNDLDRKPIYTPLPPIPTLWGAIAVDSETLATGYGKGYASRTDAERRALALCHRADGAASGCKIVAARHNSCLALATSRGGGGTDM